MVELSVVIPARNEVGNIAPLVAEIRAALDGLLAYEILYVDDGSNDATAAEVAGVATQTPQLRLLRHARSCGQSAAIRTGVVDFILPLDEIPAALMSLVGGAAPD